MDLTRGDVMNALTERPTVPAGMPAGNSGVPAGGVKMASNYYDDAGRLHRAAEPVPVDKFGRIVGRQGECRRCDRREWFAAQMFADPRKAPACTGCDRAMRPVEVKDAPPLPFREMLTAAERPLRPLWALPVLASAGWGVADGSSPWGAFLIGAPVVGELARRITARWRARRELVDSPAAARLVGYMAGASTAWLTVPAVVGVDSPFGAAVTWGSLAAAWAVPAGAWWKRRRDVPAEAEVEVVVEADPGPQEDPDERYVRLVWAARVAAKQGQQVIDPDSGQPVAAGRSGKLSETWLEDWRPVVGGWGATVVGPAGVFTADVFLGARSAIASAFSMKTSMITVTPDPDDENRADILVQRQSPIKDEVRWAGPDSIDVVAGTAPVIRLADGSHALYELYRPNWGCPHDAIFGTTGSGKSEFMNLLLTIDRWAHHVDDDGVARGIVADFLIDPQQGQSFAPFLDDLAAPVATSLEEATLLVRSLTAEMLRRNRYLAREAQTWDERRKKWRAGRKWWNPLVDGPLCVLNIDEAHDYLSQQIFATLVTKAGRMWRKCGGKVRIATHTPLLTDLGGSMALRDMLTGGFVWVGRTANSLTGATAFNGRLPVDPRTIDAVPGLAYCLTGANPKAMLGRAMWEPDFYDFVRDLDDRPIGFPGVLPKVTLDTFGTEYGRWTAAASSGELWTPEAETKPVETKPDSNAVDAVLAVLGGMSDRWVDMDDIDKALLAEGRTYATRTVRDALSTLRKADPPLVETRDRRHQLTEAGLEKVLVSA